MHRYTVGDVVARLFGRLARVLRGIATSLGHSVQGAVPLIAALLLAGCGAGLPGPTPTCAAPTMEPPPGKYPPVAVAVTLRSTTPGAAIHFTLDGSVPTAISPAYERPISVGATTTIKAIAVVAGMVDSAASGGVYELVRQRVTVHGKVLFDHGSLNAQTSDPAWFWFRDETGPLRQEIAEVITYYDPSTGSYAVTNLPQHEVLVEAQAFTPGTTASRPGSYYGSTELDLRSASTSQDEVMDLRVSRIIHLVAPDDNATTLPGGAPPAHESPVRFEWVGLREAVTYSVQIRQREAVSSRDWRERNIVDTVLGDTVFEIALSPSPEDSYYVFSLVAHNGAGDLVGELMVQWTDSTGWDYRFRVK
jgi:hypothetical protein